MKPQIAHFIEPDIEVHTKKEAAAAIRGAAHTSYAAARDNPFTMRWGTTRYTFKDGVHTKRAEEIAANIMRSPKKWVNV